MGDEAPRSRGERTEGCQTLKASVLFLQNKWCLEITSPKDKSDMGMALEGEKNTENKIFPESKPDRYKAAAVLVSVRCG